MFCNNVFVRITKDDADWLLSLMKNGHLPVHVELCKVLRDALGEFEGHGKYFVEQPPTRARIEYLEKQLEEARRRSQAQLNNQNIIANELPFSDTRILK